MNNSSFDDTIVAHATPPGVGAIAVIRVSGKEAISISNEIFYGKDLTKQATHTIHFGTIREGDKIIDEVLVSLFIAPKSFTKENVVEISTHGSDYIIQKVISLLIKTGARYATPGEFTKRAFINGQFDLAQAEAVADIIAADSEASQQAAINQLRGGISSEIKKLREQLIYFASMIELELDFSEEDVEFADRSQLTNLVNNILNVICPLIDSFTYGNAVKNGIPTVIAGKPNAGKSTLINALFNEEKAIVSEIPGTTRDTIEDQLTIQGHVFRFIDTAGLRETEDFVEAIGVKKTKEKLEMASLIIYMVDLYENTVDSLKEELKTIIASGKPFIVFGNKEDKLNEPHYHNWLTFFENENNKIPYIITSLKNIQAIELFKTKLLSLIKKNVSSNQTIVTNARHYQSLVLTEQALSKVLDGIPAGMTGDLLAMDIRQALYHLGEITGEISNEDLLDTIFSKFCIGK